MINTNNFFNFLNRNGIKFFSGVPDSVLKSTRWNLEKKNSLLSEKLDLDYLETIYRKKFMIGKSNEKVYTNY